MNKLFNHFTSVLMEPNEIKTRFDQINPSIEKEKTTTGRLIQLTQLALPFIGLHHRFGKISSLAAGGARVVCHLSNAVSAAKKREWKLCCQQMFQTAISVFIVSSGFFEFKIGLLLSNSYEITLGLYQVTKLLREKEFLKAAEESLQILASAIYVGVMLTGSLEYMLALSILQGITSIYHTRKEFVGGKYPEALLHLAMSLVRIGQAKTCYQNIVEERKLLERLKLFELYVRAKKGKETRALLETEMARKMKENGALKENNTIDKTQESANNLFKEKAEEAYFSNELMDLDGSIEKKRVVFKDAEGKEYDFGAHFHGYGKELVKGANLEFRKVNSEDENIYELSFKINHVFRERLIKNITDIKQMKSEDVRLVLQRVNSSGSAIDVSTKDFILGGNKFGESYEVDVTGLGKVIIGNSPSSFLGLSDRVVVKVNQSKNIFDFHELLSITGLETALQRSSETDIERLKIGHLYRVFFPYNATLLETSDEFFTLPINGLKETIVQMNPDMKGVMEKHLGNMQKGELLPGKVRYTIPGLAEQAREIGGVELWAGITGYKDNTELFSRIDSILNMGMLSGETRFTHGITKKGVSTTTDFETGGADSVFLNLVTKAHIESNFTKSSYSYHKFVISLDVLETGTYQYHFDSYGTRVPNLTYLKRPGIISFIEKQNIYPMKENEVMVKERVPPSLIQGLKMKDIETKDKLIDYLRNTNTIKTSESGLEVINGIPVDQFITV